MKDPEVKMTPSALKWLAEKRARLAYELQQTTAIAAVVNAKVAGLTLDVAGLDRAITVYDSRIDPQAIAPVAAWKGRYGKRGALQESIICNLKAYAPSWVGTDNLETLVTLERGISFETSAARRRWYDNSFRTRLKHLVADGYVERQHDPTSHITELGMWRWKQEKARTLAELRESSSA